MVDVNQFMAMTNLNRLKDSPLLFDNLESFVNQWAEDLKTSGEFDGVESATRTYPEIPDALRRFYELRDRWPFLKIGDQYDVFTTPKILESGHLVFCELSGNSQLAVYKNGATWELWNAIQTERKDDDPTDPKFDGWSAEDYEKYDAPTILADRVLTHQLNIVLVEMTLGALTWYPWGMTAKGGSNWYPDGDDYEFVRSLLDEKIELYTSDAGNSWFALGGCSKHWSWHPDGIIFSEKKTEYSSTTVHQLHIGVGNCPIRAKLLKNDCQPFNVPMRGPVFPQ